MPHEKKITGLDDGGFMLRTARQRTIQYGRRSSLQIQADGSCVGFGDNGNGNKGGRLNHGRDIRKRQDTPYGYRTDPFTGKRRFHNGIDLRARGEQALAMMEGMVIKVGQDRTSGKYVVLQHGNYTVSYCHLSKILVERNTLVRPRDAVGITGSTGRSTGEHLHITCKFNGKSVNPTLLFDFIKATQQECVSALARL